MSVTLLWDSQVRNYAGPAAGSVWARFSAQIFLGREDVDALAEAVLACLPEARGVV